MSQNHLIYKQIFEVEFPSRKVGMDGQNRLSQIFKRDLIPLMQQVFDEVLSTDDHLRIRRLELDLGELSAGNLEEDLAEKFASQLRDQLYKQQKTARRTHTGKNIKPSAKKWLEAEEARFRSTQQSALEQFSFFIQTGQYPWWAGKTTAATSDQLARVLIDEKAGEFKTLFATLYQTETYSRRLIHQLSDSTLEQILLLAGNRMPNRKIRSLMDDLMKLHSISSLAPLNRANFRLLVWRTVFDIWVKKDAYQKSIQPERSKTGPKPSDRKRNQIEKSLEFFLFSFLNKLAVSFGKKHLHPDRQHSLQLQIRFLQRSVSAAGMQGGPLVKLLHSVSSIKPAEWKSIEHKTGLQDDIRGKEYSKARKQVKDRSQQMDKDRETDAKTDVDRFEVNNAGLVLIAPFLPIFFDALGLLKEKSFSTPQAAEQAALILQYIATGDTEMPEHDLILNKILCGIDVDEPLPQHLEIGDREIDEVNNLLDSVIEHWSALKGTSVRGLRDTFINREGTLIPQQNGWKLFVERITPDVLIDRLPWSISIIRLPWTNDIINTEW
ncbi:contractile injection system tape measure protein [Rhodohalobacter sp. 8-1]|uniref:contractile injection system tape measure protein n=1 Tax=Rhodohalobacter sp. 8-1 TaxID=3131972 RepID=UPI0030EB2767